MHGFQRFVMQSDTLNTQLDQIGPAKSRPPDARRKRFTDELINALKESEQLCSRRTPEELAQAAWDHLQFDLPVARPEEMTALVESFR